jgi:hypothetical protein
MALEQNMLENNSNTALKENLKQELSGNHHQTRVSRAQRRPGRGGWWITFTFASQVIHIPALRPEVAPYCTQLPQAQSQKQSAGPPTFFERHPNLKTPRYMEIVGIMEIRRREGRQPPK